MKRFLSFLLALVLFALPAHAVEVELQWPQGTQFFSADGTIRDSGVINIYDSGTTDTRTTYSDSDGTVVNTLDGSDRIALDSEGRTQENVYIPTGLWKYKICDSDGTSNCDTADDLKGALDTSVFATGTVAWTLPALSYSSDDTITTSDLGKCANANPTAASFTLTLPSAATAGDGKTLCVKHVGTSNTVTIATVSSQTIDDYDTFILPEQYQTVLIYSDGVNWHVAAQATPAGSLMFTVADLLTSPPASPTPGAWYIINGTPSGDWATYADEDIVRAAGDGGWHKFTPPTDSGWLAYDQDSNTLYQFRASGWVALSNITAPSTSALSTAVLSDVRDSGTVGGDAAANGSWQTRALNTESDPDSIVTFDDGDDQFTLAAGTYSIHAAAAFSTTDETKIRIYNVTDSVTAVSSVVVDINETNGMKGELTLDGVIDIDDSKTFELQYLVTSSPNTSALGAPASVSNESEVYVNITIRDIVAQQGPQGTQGTQGAQGDAGLVGIQFTFDTDVALDADGDAGDFRFSNAGTLSSVTQISIDDSDSNSADVSTALQAWDDSDSTTRGTLTIQAPGTPSDFATYQITGAITDNSGWSVIPVSHIDSNGTFSEDESFSISFSRTGDKGDTGSTGSQGDAGPTVAVDWTYSGDVTGADPTSGIFAFSSATIASVTQVYFDDEEIGGTDVGAWIATFDDFGTTSNRGQLLFIDTSDSTAFAIYDITGSVTDNTGYWTVTLSHIASNGTFSGEVAVKFSPRGDTGSGDVTGPGSSTDNAIVRFDGTGGDTIQDSGWVLSDSDVLTAASALDMNGLDIILDLDGDSGLSVPNDDQIDIWLSAATDFSFTANTLSILTGSVLSAADTGAIQENSVSISPIGQQTVFWPAPALITRDTNGCASGTTESSSNDVNISTFDCDALTNEGVQTPMFQMPKSWDEGTVLFEVVWLSPATTSSVVWDLSGQCFTDSTLLDSAFGTSVTASDAGLGAADVAESGEIGPVTISNAGEEYSCIIELERGATDVGDTIAADVSILGLRMHYTLEAANDS